MRVVFAIALSVLLLQPTRAAADTIGIFEQLSPIPTIYVLGLGGDWLPLVGSGLLDATGTLFAVDLVLPPGPANTSTSGCEATDFVGFAAGSIALMQRGTCTFATKVANAEAAGAIGALIFNEGQAGRTDAIFATLSPFTATIPAAFLSFAVGSDLATLLASSPVTVRLRVDDATGPPTNVVPEPGALLLVATGFGLMVTSRRHRRSR